MRLASLSAAIMGALLGLAVMSGEPAAAAGASTSTSCLPHSLKAKLAQIERRFGHVTVVSTYRPGAVIASSGHPSRHATCQAVDFKPAPGTYKKVASWLKANHNGGVGTYSCGMHHIHIDNGPPYRWHTCAH